MTRSPSPASSRLLRTSAAALLLTPLSVPASMGPFEHGAGIKSLGSGGVSYVGAQETTALSANPSQALELGRRYDVGVDVLLIKPAASIEGNALGADEHYNSDGHNWYLIPQAGISMPLADNWALGVTMLSAGVGPDYTNSPYERFGGAPRASLALGSASIATALAWRPVEHHSFGAGLVVGYETLSVKGLEFLTSTDPAYQVSVQPDRVTNQGKEGAFSIGFSLGWTAHLTPELTLGAGYRSKAWTQKLDEYAGLLPDGGSLELPAVYGAAVAWQALPDWTLALEWQRYEYASEKAFGNPISRLSEGQLLGSPDGPGFGLSDQNAYKLGVSWKATPALELRAGYVRANQNVQESDTLFPVLAPVVLTTHYTTGATYAWQAWDFTVAFAYCPRTTVDGSSSIPPAFGGGEADVHNEFTSFGFSLGKRF